jgi:ribosomal protein S18 acetylase RimI-like enzyme
MKEPIFPFQAEHIPAATSVLTAAFIADTGIRAICTGKTEQHYQHVVSAWFVAMLRLQLKTHQPAWVVVVDDVLVGVALLNAPQARFSPKAWFNWIVAVGRRCGWQTVVRTIQHDQRRAAYRPKPPHSVLEFLAVDRNYQGRGYARLLLEQALQSSRLHPTSTGVWLETTRKTNLPFFTNAGYQQTGHLVFAQGESFFLFQANA